ncbi:MAG: ABATE domain-containing protein [Blastocatellia bacterium]
MKLQPDTSRFYLVGNNLSIDFVNTRIRVSGAPKDLLESFEDLVAWAMKAELLDVSQAGALIRDWSGRPKAAQVFKRARQFREVLRELMTDLTQGAAIRPSALDAINAILREESGYAEVVRTGSGFEKRYHTDFSEPGRLIAPIAEAAADLLCYGNPAYLRKCETPECEIFFYDITKNHGRRWCSMAICGNRAKAAAFYRRRCRS